MFKALLKRKSKSERPVHTVRSGNMNAAIWLNRTPRGWQYRVTTSRLQERKGKASYSRGFYVQDVIDHILMGFELAEFFAADRRLPQPLREELQACLETLFVRDHNAARSNGLAK